MPALQERSVEKELMDDLHSGGAVIDQTLRELDVINRLLGGNAISINALKQLTRQAPQSEYLVADLGCGSGDIMILMAKWARKQGINMQFVGVDANPNIIAYAEDHCRDYPEISFQVANIFSEDFQAQEFDIIHSSLFTHHFSSEELIDLFSVWKAKTSVGIIVNDLHRHWLAWHSIRILTRLLSRSEMVRNDAAVSVARGFKRGELKSILDKAGIGKRLLSWRWAFRWKVIYRT
ncbi:MAG: methyltransferase domain-containing protein [Bacteroidota bacterium]